MNPFFNWLKDSGTQAMLVLVGTVAAIVAAFAAIYFGRKSLTKGDLAPIEENTSHLEHVKSTITRMDDRAQKEAQQQAHHAAMVERAKQIRASVSGEAMGTEDLPLRIMLQDPAIVLTRLELCNEAGTGFGGSYTFRSIQPLIYEATVDFRSLTQWYGGGRLLESANQRLLNLKAWTTLEGEKVYREIAVQIVMGTRWVSQGPPGNPTSTSMNVNVYTIFGNV